MKSVKTFQQDDIKDRRAIMQNTLNWLLLHAAAAAAAAPLAT